MSRGLGRTQRAILALIAQAKPIAAWTFPELCGLIFGGLTPTRAQLSSVARAIKRMHLPGTWTVGRVVGRRGQWLLYDTAALPEPWLEVQLIDIATLEVELP
jgi:hypothetical protein